MAPFRAILVRAVMKLSDAYVHVCMLARAMILSLLMLVGHSENISSGYTLRAATCDNQNITGFVSTWYSATSNVSISSLYNFAEKGVKGGYLHPNVLEKDLHLFYIREGVLYRSVINLSGEEKEFSTNTDIVNMDLQSIPGKPC